MFPETECISHCFQWISSDAQNSNDSSVLRLTRLQTQQSGIYSCSLQGRISLEPLHRFDLRVQSRALLSSCCSTHPHTLTHTHTFTLTLTFTLQYCVQCCTARGHELLGL